MSAMNDACTNVCAKCGKKLNTGDTWKFDSVVSKSGKIETKFYHTECKR